MWPKEMIAVSIVMAIIVAAAAAVAVISKQVQVHSKVGINNFILLPHKFPFTWI